MRYINAIAVVLLTSIHPSTHGAELLWSSDGYGGYNLSVQGEILSGDHERLLRLVHSQPARFLHTDTIILSSPGGSVSDALGIAEFVRKSSLITQVDPTGECSSACFLILAGSDFRVLGGTVRIHRPFMAPESYLDRPAAEAQAEHEAGIHRVRQFLVSRLVPSHLIDKLISLPSTESYELSASDLVSMGALSPGFEETTIAKCGFSARTFSEPAANSTAIICVKQIQASARYTYLLDVLGQERARAALREHLLSIGGIELKDGRIILPD